MHTSLTVGVAVGHKLMSAEEEVTVTCWVEEEGEAINVVVQVLVQVLWLMVLVDMAVVVTRVLDVTVVVIVGSKLVTVADEHTSLIVVVAISIGCDSE